MHTRKLCLHFVNRVLYNCATNSLIEQQVTEYNTLFTALLKSNNQISETTYQAHEMLHQWPPV